MGLACLDIVNVVEKYPEEDCEVRITDSTMVRGGNATNSMVVASQLGGVCTWLGRLSDPSVDSHARFIADDLRRHGVDPSFAVFDPSSTGLPTSYITLAADNGSRTILHHRGPLPEFSFEDFRGVMQRFPDGPPPWDWVHFEARNVEDTLRMMATLRTYCKPCGASPWRVAVDERGLVVSVELEKAREGCLDLVPLADVVLVSREFARLRGLETPEAMLTAIAPLARAGALIVCTWGSEGAYALDMSSDGTRGGSRDLPVLHAPAQPPPHGVVDTLGAGDTFTAALIVGLGKGLPLLTALQGACSVAGMKVGVRGLDIVDALRTSPDVAALYGL